MGWGTKLFCFILPICSLLALAGCSASEPSTITRTDQPATLPDNVSPLPDTTPTRRVDEGLPKLTPIVATSEVGDAVVTLVLPDTNQVEGYLPEMEKGEVVPASLPTAGLSPTPDMRLDPKYWPEWPLIPTVSARAREIFALGQQMGNDPHSFTTIGDCQSEPSVFMGVYDSDRYFLGEGYEYLEQTIRQFKGSFQRDSVTVKDGMSVASVLSPVWADPERCEPGETPLACEIRLHRPVIAFVNLGTNWQGGDDVKHEAYMRQVVEVLIENGVVPIISTKGDNLEGDHRLNRSMARVAHDYDLPLWNFWRAIRDLPGKGIDGTRPGGYLTTEAWARRSFTGLQALDAVWRELSR